MRLLVSFLVLAGLLLTSWAIWGSAWDDRFTLQGTVATLEAAGPWGWALGIGLLIADLVLPVPGTIVMSGLGYLYGALVGGFFAASGGMLAGLAGYGVGRLCGERCARRWLGDADFERGRRFFSRGGGWIVALSRALPILPEVIACMAGLVRMRFSRFVLALTCGCLPMGMLFSAIGSAGRETPGWALLFSLVVPAGLWITARQFFKKS